MLLCWLLWPFGFGADSNTFNNLNYQAELFWHEVRYLQMILAVNVISRWDVEALL